MSFDNVNVNVSGPVQPTSTYKTKVLKGNHSFASQVTEPNIKYVIKHDFDLNGESVTIPENCILEFDGGSISGAHTITGNNTSIEAGLVKIFNTNVIIDGSLNIKRIYPEWFGASKNSESTTAIQKCVDIAIVCKKDVFLSTNYIVSNPIVITEKVNILGNTDKYSIDNITASPNFASTTLNGYTCNAIFECRRPILLHRVGINGNGVANGIQWYEGYAEGSIAKCYIHNCKSACIIGSVVESFTIEDNYLASTPMGIVFTSYAFTDNYSPTIFTLQRNNKLLGRGFMLYINRNLIQCYGIGIFLQGQSDVSILQNMTAHNQINGIWAKDCIGLTIDSCYSEGDGVCVGDGYTLVNGTEPAITANQTLINKNIDGYVYNGTAYRSPVFLGATSEIVVRNYYVSYKKRGQSSTIDVTSTNREDAGVDAIFTIDDCRHINIEEIVYKNWNGLYREEATIFDLNMFASDLRRVRCITYNPQPINFINTYIANISNCKEFNTGKDKAEVIDADDNNYSPTISYNPAAYTQGLSDMNVTLVDKIGKEEFYKFNTATDTMYFCIKNLSGILVTPKTYIQVILPVRCTSDTTSMVLTATTWGGGTKTYTTKCNVIPNKFYNHRIFIPINSDVTNATVQVSLNGTDNDNVLFGKLKAYLV